MPLLPMLLIAQDKDKRALQAAAYGVGALLTLAETAGPYGRHGQSGESAGERAALDRVRGTGDALDSAR